MSDTVAIGTRVWVQSIEGKDLGEGVYQGEVPLDAAFEQDPQIPVPPPPSDIPTEEFARRLEMIDEFIANGGTTPKIQLDTGETVYGFQCFWGEVEDDI